MKQINKRLMSWASIIQNNTLEQAVCGVLGRGLPARDPRTAMGGQRAGHRARRREGAGRAVSMRRNGPRSRPASPSADERPELALGYTQRGRKPLSAADEWYDCPVCMTRFATLREFDVHRAGER